MALPPRNHKISLEEAAAHTRRHREAKVHPINAGAFHADQVRELLAHPDCAALRIYHGRDEKGAPTFVLVAADAAGNDLTGGAVLEVMFPCPPVCPVNSPLNA